jgi:hypothetical protein
VVNASMGIQMPIQNKTLYVIVVKQQSLNMGLPSKNNL